MNSFDDLQQWLMDETNPTVAIMLLSENYSSFSEEFILGDLSRSYHNERLAKGLSTWIKGSNDCKVFSVGAWNFALECHARASNNETGVAFGLIIYLPDGKTLNHCRCCARVLKEGKPKLLVWEPQNQRMVTLSLNEKNNTFNIVM